MFFFIETNKKNDTMKKVRDKMINYIILEENINYLPLYKEMVEKVMIHYDIEYDLKICDKFTEKTKKLLPKEGFNIYIINLKQELNGYEMIEYIREKLDDWQSLIISLYNSNEEKEKVSKRNFFLLDNVLRHQNSELKLRRNIQICLKHYDQRPNTLKYCYKKTCYNIEFCKIVYIEKELEGKRCRIKTTEKDYYVPMCIKEIESKLDNRFYKSSRSYIINLEQIDYYDQKNNIVRFKNKDILDAVSRDKKKKIINYLRGIE